MRTQDMRWLAEFTAATVDACRVAPGRAVVGDVVNALPFTVLRPGGRDCYPAIWVQDFTMIFSSGFVTTREGMEHLKLFLRCQHPDRPRRLGSGALIPSHAIPDHVLLDGSPVFFPGTYSAGDDQGGEPWGVCPPYNNHYDVVWLAHLLVARTQRADFLLDTEVDGVSLYQRLRNAYEVPRCDPATGIVYTTAAERAVGFIFCDSVYMTGSLLMASLLRVRASDQLAGLASALGREAEAAFYASQARLGRDHILPTFAGTGDQAGWLLASTGVSPQPDVWGTIYAVFLNALPPTAKQAAVETIRSALGRGTIESEGALRHVPTDHDASGESAWERANAKHNRYQNGAYWHMPTGWLAAILQEEHPREAQALKHRYLTHLREQAFTRGPAFGAPWECIGWGGAACQNPVFAPSVTVPYGVWANVDGRCAHG